MKKTKYRILYSGDAFWKYKVQIKYSWFPFWLTRESTDFKSRAEEYYDKLINDKLREVICEHEK